MLKPSITSRKCKVMITIKRDPGMLIYGNQQFKTSKKLYADIKFCYKVMIKAFSCLWPQISLIFKDAFSLRVATSVKEARCSVCIYNFLESGVKQKNYVGAFSLCIFLNGLLCSLFVDQPFCCCFFFLTFCVSLFYPCLSVKYSMQYFQVCD